MLYIKYIHIDKNTARNLKLSFIDKLPKLSPVPPMSYYLITIINILSAIFHYLNLALLIGLILSFTLI